MIPESEKTAYPTLELQNFISYSQMLAQLSKCNKFKSKEILSMENLPLYALSGQNFGYIVYRKKFFTLEDDTTIRLQVYFHAYI